MDHVRVWASKWVPSDSFPMFYNYHFDETKWMDVHLGLSERTLRERELLQYTCRLTPVYAEAEAGEALGRVRRDFMTPGDVSFLRDVATVVSNLADISRSAAATRGFYFASPLYYDMEHSIEQAPNRNSKVVISDRRDALGSLVADLDWQLSEADYRSYRIGHDIVGTELAALGWGRMMPEEVTPDLVRSRVAGVNHHIGTTRMSATPSGGVVDPDCKVHGISNLYVGGSSVFPSAAGGSPTMMIIALSLRLSELLRRRLAL
jgi:choline dehydrogenase-like flavoprotein